MSREFIPPDLWAPYIDPVTGQTISIVSHCGRRWVAARGGPAGKRGTVIACSTCGTPFVRLTSRSRYCHRACKAKGDQAEKKSNRPSRSKKRCATAHGNATDRAAVLAIVCGIT